MVTVLGGGPAGSAAAIACRAAGTEVTVVEKSRFPRHKVCGEFLSAEIQPLLARLGLWDEFLARRPQPYRRLALHFPATTKSGWLPEPAFGLSRHCLDQLLLDRAIAAGARITRDIEEVGTGQRPLIIACGRAHAAPRGKRLFGFKSHFCGPLTDSVELFFWDDCYVGVNCVEGGVTNVCGLGPESLLARYRFQPDELLSQFPRLRERLAPLVRTMPWLTTGPVRFGANWNTPCAGIYPAGDALGFVDPFTGTGLLAALLTGISAGEAAAVGHPAADHVQRCRGVLERQQRFSALVRYFLTKGWASRVVDLVPLPWLVGKTRPRIEHK